MDDFLDSSDNLFTKKNLISLLILAIMIVAIPIGVKLIQNQQILKSRALAPSIQFTGQGVTCNGKSCVTTQVDSTGHATVDLEITSPLGPPSGGP